MEAVRGAVVYRTKRWRAATAAAAADAVRDHAAREKVPANTASAPAFEPSRTPLATSANASIARSAARTESATSTSGRRRKIPPTTAPKPAPVPSIPRRTKRALTPPPERCRLNAAVASRYSDTSSSITCCRNKKRFF